MWRLVAWSLLQTLTGNTVACAQGVFLWKPRQVRALTGSGVEAQLAKMWGGTEEQGQSTEKAAVCQCLGSNLKGPTVRDEAIERLEEPLLRRAVKVAVCANA